MHAMACRTLIIDPTEEQKKAYQIIFEAQQHLIENLKVDAVLKDVYNSTKEFIKSKNSDLADRVHTHFGFGIGYSLKEDQVSINGNNSRKVKAGMVFHVKIAIQKLTDKGKGVYIAIGDTVLVKGEEAVCLTGNIPKKLG